MNKIVFLFAFALFLFNNTLFAQGQSRTIIDENFKYRLTTYKSSFLKNEGSMWFERDYFTININGKARRGRVMFLESETTIKDKGTKYQKKTITKSFVWLEGTESAKVTIIINNYGNEYTWYYECSVDFGNAKKNFVCGGLSE